MLATVFGLPGFSVSSVRGEPLMPVEVGVFPWLSSLVFGVGAVCWTDLVNRSKVSGDC